MSRTDIDDTVRDMWSTRPPRRRDDRKIAGVAAAIGRRYRIDPILVRVGFVITTVFGGVGIMLYLLGWLLLPEDGDEVSGAEALIGHGRSRMSKPLTVVLALALIPASTGLFTAQTSALFSVAAVAGALFLLHRNRGGAGPAVPGPDPMVAFDTTPGGAAAGWPDPTVSTGMPPDMTPTTPISTAASPTPASSGVTAHVTATGPTPMATSDPATRPTSSDAAPDIATPGAPASGSAPGTAAPGTWPTAGTGAAPPGPPGTAPLAGDGGGERRSSPPSWDPLGVAPFAWDLPEPGSTDPAPPAAKRRRSAVTPVTLALALVAAGVTALVALSSSALGATEVFAVTLGVVGAGLVIGSLVRGGRGLIAVAIPLGIVTYAMSVVPPDGFGPGGFGDRDWTPLTVADLEHPFRHSAGDATLDLRQLQLPEGQTTTVTVQLGAGDLKVHLPSDADLQVHCEAGVGDVSCLTDKHDGRSVVLDDSYESSTDKKLVLNASVGAGEVKVSRED